MLIFLLQVEGVRGDELNAISDPNSHAQRPDRPTMEKSSLKWTQVSASTRPVCTSDNPYFSHHPTSLTLI
jgi:hypothetical protein